MGLREKIERALAPLNYPNKEVKTHDSFGYPLPRPTNEDSTQSTDTPPVESGTPRRAMESARDFYRQAIGETACCGATGGLVITHQAHAAVPRAGEI